MTSMEEYLRALGFSPNKSSKPERSSGPKKTRGKPTQPAHGRAETEQEQAMNGLAFSSPAFQSPFAMPPFLSSLRVILAHRQVTF